MDWSKLSSNELTDFLRLYNVKPVPGNLTAQAQLLFNQIISQFGLNGVFTKPVADLYIASIFKVNIPQKYTPEQIRNLSPEISRQFAMHLDYQI